MGRRITRKQLKQDDEFVSAAEQIFRWVSDNVRPLLAAVGVVCAVALIWWGVASWLGARSNDAALLLNHAITTFEGDAPGAVVPQGDVAAAEAAFQEVVDSYGKTAQGDMARLYLARIALGRGEADRARAMFVELAARQPDNLIGRLATLDLMDLRIASGQGDEVAGELEAMVSGSDPTLPRDTALYKLGELLMAESQPDRARPYLERLVEEFPESPYLPQARQKLSELG